MMFHFYDMFNRFLPDWRLRKKTNLTQKQKVLSTNFTIFSRHFYLEWDLHHNTIYRIWWETACPGAGTISSISKLSLRKFFLVTPRFMDSKSCEIWRQKNHSTVLRRTIRKCSQVKLLHLKYVIFPMKLIYNVIARLHTLNLCSTNNQNIGWKVLLWRK